MLLKDFKNKTDFDASKKYLESLISSNYTGSGYHKRLLKHYIAIELNEKEMENKLELLRLAAYKVV